MTTTAIIPARGGSKGIPRKNLQDVGGMSLIKRAVRLCRLACDRVIVSTDDYDISVEAAKAGASVVRRPDRLATDTASTHEVLRFVRDTCNLAGRILLHQCTAPATIVQDLVRCLDGMAGYDLACCVYRYDGLVIQDGRCINASLTTTVPRRQDLEQYEIAGSAWAFDASYLDKPFYSGNVNWIVCDGKRLDIDTPYDLWVARQLIKEPVVMPDMAWQ